jgi:hypothetical protein
MRSLLTAALMLVAVPALADEIDDYVSCMVGQSAVVLREQGSKDPYEAQEIAYDLCAQPEGLDASVADYVALMVERMAAE